MATGQVRDLLENTNHRILQFDGLHTSPDFTCDGIDKVPGFRKCNSPSKTLMDKPFVDGGAFNGVAFHVKGDEAVIRSQLRAGWYRYTSEWRFTANGTIFPRWGFGGVKGGTSQCCVCEVHHHHHHAYWRLDFDFETSTGNLVTEVTNAKRTAIAFETRREKDAANTRHWEVQNSQTNRGYAIRPGKNDGTSDPESLYGFGDLWVLNKGSGPIDDGQRAIIDDDLQTDPAHTRVHFENLTNGEALKGRDLVVWYAAHFKHDQKEGGHSDMEGGHIVGPTLTPINW